MKNLNYSDACSLADYHERTGDLPNGISEAYYNHLMKKHNIIIDNEPEIDPAGGYGINSHI